MEKRQYELCIEILRRFHKTGILDDFILVGSWCVYFYKVFDSKWQKRIVKGLEMVKEQEILNVLK